MACRYGYKKGQGGDVLDQDRETDLPGEVGDLLEYGFPGRTHKIMRSVELVAAPSSAGFLMKFKTTQLSHGHKMIRSFSTESARNGHSIIVKQRTNASSYTLQN